MKKLFVFIIKGLIASGFDANILEMKDNHIRFSCNLKDLDYDMFIEIRFDAVFKVRLFKGELLHKDFTVNGSKTFIEAKNAAILCKKLMDFLGGPEKYYHRIKVVNKSDKLYHYVGLRIGKRIHNTLLNSHELLEYSDFVVNPAELGKINIISRHGRSYQSKYQGQTIKVRGSANKLARASQYQGITYPKGL